MSIQRITPPANGAAFRHNTAILRDSSSVESREAAKPAKKKRKLYNHTYEGRKRLCAVNVDEIMANWESRLEDVTVLDHIVQVCMYPYEVKKEPQ
jgi:hypothetical protein